MSGEHTQMSYTLMSNQSTEGIPGMKTSENKHKTL